MAFGGSAPNKVFTRTDGSRSGAAVCQEAKNAAINDTAVLADARENDLAGGLNLCLTRDGGTQPTAAMPWNAQRLTGLGQGTARTDAISLDQLQDGDHVFASVSGTANAIALTTTPTCTPVAGMVIRFFATADNTSTTTVNLNTGGALALQVGGAACAGGEVNNGQMHEIGFDGTQWQLVNPYGAALFQPLDADLTAIAALATAAYGRALLTQADEAAFKATVNLEANTDFYAPGGTDVAVADGGTGASTAAGARTNLAAVGSAGAQRFTSGSGTYTPTAGTLFIRVRMGGGGGGGGAATTNNGAAGTDSSFGSWTAIHGDGGGCGGAAAIQNTAGIGGTGGANGTGTLINRVSGARGYPGGEGPSSAVGYGGGGGVSPFGGAGATIGVATGSFAGDPAKANSCSGGGGGANSSGNSFAAGGGSGEYVEFYVSSPAPTAYTVGAGGAGGAAGVAAGGNGAAGVIIVEEFA